MVFIEWITEHWVVLERIGFIAGLFFAGHAFHTDAKERRIQSLLTLTKEHRDIWSELYSQPELARVLDPNADVAKKPVTAHEQLFVKFLVFHLYASFRAMKAGFFTSPEALEKDIRGFFSLPIPRGVWLRLRATQDGDFAEFIERHLATYG